MREKEGGIRSGGRGFLDYIRSTLYERERGGYKKRW
jgi:hypothetical protein